MTISFRVVSCSGEDTGNFCQVYIVFLGVNKRTAQRAIFDKQINELFHNMEAYFCKQIKFMI